MTVFMCALLGAVLNRFSGYTNITWLPGRNIYWAILAATLIAGFAVDWVFALWLGLSVALYRLPGWYKSIDMGKNEGTLLIDAMTMYLRTLYMAPVFIYGSWVMGVWYAPLALVVAALGAVAAYIIGNYVVGKFMKDPFWFIEAAAGACLGAAVSTMVV